MHEVYELFFTCILTHHRKTLIDHFETKINNLTNCTKWKKFFYCHAFANKCTEMSLLVFIFREHQPNLYN